MLVEALGPPLRHVIEAELAAATTDDPAVPLDRPGIVIAEVQTCAKVKLGWLPQLNGNASTMTLGTMCTS